MPSGRIGGNTGDRTPTAGIYIQLFTSFAAYSAACADSRTCTEAGIARAAFCSHLRTAADLDLCDLRITVAAANAASISAAHGIDNTAEDTNGRFIRAVRAAANACNGIIVPVINRCRIYRAVKDGDVSRAQRTTADRCRPRTRFCCHLSVLDGNFARALITTAANACTARSTFCIDFSVCNFQLRGALTISSSTNTRSFLTTNRVQRGACIFCCDGQLSARSFIILFHTGAAPSTLQGIVALQLQGRIARALDGHCSFSSAIFSTAHIDIHIFDRDRRILFGAVVDDLDDILHRFVHSLCHRAGSVGS